MRRFLTSITLFWSLPTAFLGGMAAAAAIAVIISVGTLSGFCSPFFIGWMKDLTGSMATPLYIFALLGVVGVLMAFATPRDIVNR